MRKKVKRTSKNKFNSSPFTSKMSIHYKPVTLNKLSCSSFHVVNKPLRVAGMSADQVRGWEIVWKMNIWPRSEALRANMKFLGQSLSQGHYQPTYQQARKKLKISYFITLPLIFISYLTSLQKASVDQKANCWEWVHLIGLTLFPPWLDQNLTGCYVKWTFVVPQNNWHSLALWFVFCCLLCNFWNNNLAQLSNVTIARLYKRRPFFFHVK